MIMTHRKKRLGTEDYQKVIIEEYGIYGGATKTASNMCRTINTTYKLVDTLPPVKGKESILKAVLAERKRAIKEHPHMNERLRAIMFRYLFAVHAECIKTFRSTYKSSHHGRRK